jgi:enediyne biosynthesis protein E4
MGPLKLTFAVVTVLGLAGCGGGQAEGTARETERPLFVDRAAETGLDFTHFNGSTGKLYYAEIMGSGGALLDADNDGDLDVFLVQGRTLDPAERPPRSPGHRLYRNDLSPTGRLRFTPVDGLPPARGYGMGVAAGDVDNDGWTDLYVTGHGGSQMLRNNGDGTFRDATDETGTPDGRWTASAAFFDYDRDGWLDLYVVRYVAFDVRANKRCHAMTGEPDYCAPHDFAPVPDRLLHNRGDGTFEDVSAAAGILAETGRGLGVVTGDLDADGWPDTYVSNDGMPNVLWINQRDGTFANRAGDAGCAVDGDGKPKAGMGLAAGDVDADGDEDLVVTNLALEMSSFYRNEGDLLFTDASDPSRLGSPSWENTGFGTAWLDLDNDGWLDLMTVNGGVEKVPTMAAMYDPRPLDMPRQLYRNRGDARFEEISATAGPAFALEEVGRGLATGDVDNDGDTDALVTNNGGPVRLLINQTGAARSWLGLRLIGAQGRDALGAWVGVLRSGAPDLWRRVRTDGSYLTASDPRLLFGLGDSPKIESVRVVWPDGRTEAFQARLGRYTTLREGTGLPAR